ncbi:ATP dependent DNA ligase [Sinorhizobium meliloti]
MFTGSVLVAEVEYRVWTDDGKLRHASFKAIRPREDDATLFDLQ